MEKKFIINKSNVANIDIDSSEWEKSNFVYIDCFNWDEYTYKPNTKVYALYSDAGLTFKFSTNENPVTVKYTKLNEPTYMDSCVEVFFNPSPETDERYMNFEINAGGAFLLGFGKDRNSRENLYDIDIEIFEIQTKIAGDGWSAKIFIPFEFLKRYYSDLSMIMSGNFQKCGDETEKPHYGSWSLIDTKEPDFHRPEFFGKFILKD